MFRLPCRYTRICDTRSCDGIGLSIRVWEVCRVPACATRASGPRASGPGASDLREFLAWVLVHIPDRARLHQPASVCRPAAGAATKLHEGIVGVSIKPECHQPCRYSEWVRHIFKTGLPRTKRGIFVTSVANRECGEAKMYQLDQGCASGVVEHASASCHTQRCSTPQDGPLAIVVRWRQPTRLTSSVAAASPTDPATPSSRTVCAPRSPAPRTRVPRPAVARSAPSPHSP